MFQRVAAWRAMLCLHTLAGFVCALLIFRTEASRVRLEKTALAASAGGTGRDRRPGGIRWTTFGADMEPVLLQVSEIMNSRADTTAWILLLIVSGGF